MLKANIKNPEKNNENSGDPLGAQKAIFWKKYPTFHLGRERAPVLAHILYLAMQ